MAFSYALIISAIKKTNVHRYADSVHLSKSKIPCSEKYFPGKSGISIIRVALGLSAFGYNIAKVNGLCTRKMLVFINN